MNNLDKYSDEIFDLAYQVLAIDYDLDKKYRFDDVAVALWRTYRRLIKLYDILDFLTLHPESMGKISDYRIIGGTGTSIFIIFDDFHTVTYRANYSKTSDKWNLKIVAFWVPIKMEKIIEGKSLKKRFKLIVSSPFNVSWIDVLGDDLYELRRELNKNGFEIKHIDPIGFLAVLANSWITSERVVMPE